MTEPKYAIGLVEFNSIAVGIEAADAMLKVSEVELLMAKTVCPGKYICCSDLCFINQKNR